MVSTGQAGECVGWDSGAELGGVWSVVTCTEQGGVVQGELTGTESHLAAGKGPGWCEP